MDIIQKYEKILSKPMPEPFLGYVQELLEYIKKPAASKKIGNQKPEFKDKFYTPENTDA